MSGTASKLRELRLELAVGGFGTACAVTLFLFPRWETFPAHLLWVSLMLAYGFRVWSRRATTAVLAATVAVTASAFSFHAVAGKVEWDELVEVPLMAAVFVAAVAHARRREAALGAVRRASQRERDFVREASHRLRTPITIARGHAELLRASAAGPEAAADADTVIEELDRLARIASQLLVLAAAEHPDFLAREPVDFERLIVATAKRWGPAARRRWLVSPEVEGSLFVDRDRLGFALDALIENAVKFTDESDRIGIIGRAEGGTAVIEISNTGPAIPVEDLPRIFDRFYRGEAPSGRIGTGLGLAIVKAVVEAHGGEVTAESGRERGVVFTLRLPGFRPELPERETVTPRREPDGALAWQGDRRA